MLLEEQEIELLAQIGFSRTQAKLYLTLLKMEEADGRALSKNSNIPRPVVYRTLDELQKKGLVEKEISIAPYRFRVTPIDYALEILMMQRFQQYQGVQEKTKEFFLRMQNCREKTQKEQEYKVVMIEGRERIIQKIRSLHDNVQRSVDILSTPQRWLQISDFCYENHKQALERNVKYRIVIEEPSVRIEFKENLKTLLAKPNFKLKFSRSALKTNSAIFDGNEATFNFFPSKSLAESPIMWTNHPSFISMCQDQFDKMWKSSLEYKIQYEKGI
jgi:sugar-specific transcriptional regulator TrmB